MQILENQGLFIQRLEATVKSTVLFVSADNLAAHSLAGFQESFTIDIEHYCVSTTGTRIEIAPGKNLPLKVPARKVVGTFGGNEIVMKCSFKSVSSENVVV